MVCPSCKTDNAADAAFCEQCGAKLVLVCPACKATVNPGARFCKKCGTAIGANAAAAKEFDDAPIRVAETPAAENVDGERKTVTALFADIKGSMDLMEDLDPEEARAIVDPALKLMMDAVHRYGGYVAQSTGDGIFALFGAPVAHEDHPLRALYAALRIQEEMSRYSAKLREAGNPPIEARVGINTGEVVVRSIKTGDGHTEYAPIGHSTSLASRMQTLAPTGSIAITETTQKLCAGYFNFKALGPTRVKGVSEPVSIFEVVGLGPLRTRLQRSAGRGFTKFVGRSREMDALRHVARLAADGHGQIAAAVAEAGTGKSRLFFEFKVTNQSGWMTLETFSVSHGKASGYLPVIELLRNYFEISSEEDERKRRERVNGKVLTLDRSLEDAIPYLFGLLGIFEATDPLAQMDPQIRKRRTLDAIKRLLLRESLNQPLMIVFEDLHWIDDETQALLNLLADSIGNTRILLLVNYRPEYRHEWGQKTYYTQLRLDPLGAASAEEMLAVLLGEGKELDPLKQLIVAKTEGNPLFIEELVQELFDDGVLLRNGSIQLAKPISEMRIPPTVQGILSSRIDRLPAEEKEFLQTLAAVGKEFSLAVVRKVVAKPDEELQRMLFDLQLAEFIYEEPSVGDVQYTFKHALTQEVAYNSILIERRHQLQERIAAAIENLFAQTIDDHLTRLAHHYGRSANTAKAVDYLLRSGRQAIQRSAFAEGLASLTRGLELLQKLPDRSARLQQELRFQNALIYCWQPVLSVSSHEVRSAMERVVFLSEQIGDSAALLQTVGAMCFSYLDSLELGKADDLARKSVAIVAELRSSRLIAAAHMGAMGQVRLAQGEFVAARKHFEIGVGIGDVEWRQLGFGARCFFLNFFAQDLWVLGYPDQAVRRTEEMLLLDRNESSPYLKGLSQHFALQVRVLMRDRNALEDLRRLLDSLADRGVSFVIHMARFALGGALVEHGSVAEGLAELEQALQDRLPVQMPRYGVVEVMLADAYNKAGRAADGLALVDDALHKRDAAGHRMFVAELHRLRGELLLTSNSSDSGEARRELETAIAIAREQAARSWELRAIMSLARLLAKQGKRDEARVMLADIYHWFTEGFDTADLKDARALLEELS